MAKPKFDPFFIYDAASQEAGFERVRALIEAVPEADIASPKVDLNRVVASVRNVIQFLCDRPDLVERFRALPATEFDIAHLESLSTINAAVGHCHRQHILSAGDEGGISPELRDEAEKLEKRMQHTLEYNLSDNAEVQPRLVQLAEGRGYRDLINDLFGYSDLYEQYADVLKRDGNKYDPTHPARAVELASRIDALLTAQNGKKWSELRDRAFALLVKSFEEVSVAARWMLRNEPRSAAQFASIYTKGRRRPKATTAAVAPGPVEEPTPE